MRKAAFVPVAIVSLLAACAHKTRLDSSPAGADVYVNDQFACRTPCTYSTPATQLKQHTPVRVERAGYQTVESELQTKILAGRIIAGLFTVGLVPLFKWPHSYHSVHSFQLRTLSFEERLERLKQLQAEGKINDEEYRELRRQLVP